MFGNSKEKKEKKEKAAWEVYADKYIEGIERLHAIGGFQLVAFAIGVAVVVASTNDAIGNALPALVVSGTLISVMGVALHVIEVKRKESAFQKSSDNYYSMTSELWKLYVQNLSKRDIIDSAVITTSLEELNKIIQKNDT